VNLFTPPHRACFGQILRRLSLLTFLAIVTLVFSELVFFPLFGPWSILVRSSMRSRRGDGSCGLPGMPSPLFFRAGLFFCKVQNVSPPPAVGPVSGRSGRKAGPIGGCHSFLLPWKQRCPFFTWETFSAKPTGSGLHARYPPPSSVFSAPNKN